MSRPLVNPHLLQLAAIGIEDDHYLEDGRHLRWTFSPDLGFPRAGFRLYRRSIPVPWTAKRTDVPVRRAVLRGEEIEYGELRHPSGLHITADDGVEPAPGDRPIGIAVDENAVRLRFTEDGKRGSRSMPACWVLLRYRHRTGGSIDARAVYADGEEVRVQDRSASGGIVQTIAGVDATDVRTVDGVAMLPSSFDADLDEARLRQRTAETALALEGEYGEGVKEEDEPGDSDESGGEDERRDGNESGNIGDSGGRTREVPTDVGELQDVGELRDVGDIPSEIRDRKNIGDRLNSSDRQKEGSNLQKDSGSLQNAGVDRSNDTDGRFVDATDLTGRVGELPPDSVDRRAVDPAGSARSMAALSTTGGAEPSLLERILNALARIPLLHRAFDWLVPRLPEPIRPRIPWPPWVTGTMLLNGSVIDEVRLSGASAELEMVEWITVEEYANADGWEPVDTFHLPIDGDGITYPPQPDPGEEIATDRLHHSPPVALGPWEHDEWPPDPDPEDDVEAWQHDRYLDSYDELEAALETIVSTEAFEAIPQRAVRYGEDEPMNAVEGTSPDLSGSSMRFSILEMLQAASLDPGVARTLGLATSDFEANEERVDYLLGSDWWRLWVAGTIAPEMRDRALELFGRRAVNDHGVRLPHVEMLSTPRLNRRSSTGHTTDSNDAFSTIVSVATDVSVEPRDPVPTPSDLDATVETRVGVSDVPATVPLTWDGEETNLFAEDGHVAYGIRRKDDRGEESITRTDPDTGAALPYQPATDDAIRRFVDRDVSLGDATYRVSGMDVWGRWSDFAETDVTVTDDVPPPTPTGLEAALEGEAPTWELDLSFDWTAGQQVLAPDVTAFAIHFEREKVAHDFENWQGCEKGDGSYADLTVSWPDLSVTTTLPGVTAVSSTGQADGSADDERLTVTIPDVAVPFDDDHRARVSVSVEAIDDTGNVSEPARRAVAERIDEAEPEPPTLTGEIQRGTWPDADNRSYWTVEWDAQPDGSSATVLTASEVRLLAADGGAPPNYDTMNDAARVTHLRGIAVNNQHVFSPAHVESYDDGETRHQLSLPAEDRSLTVVTVRHTGPTGTRAPWPDDGDAFAVVETPTTVEPPTPRLSAVGEDERIRIRLSPGIDGPVEEIRLYRTGDRDAVGDVRRMRPLPPIDGTEGGPYEVNLLDGDTAYAIELVDGDIPADRWTAYRAIAVGPSGIRSEPTSPEWVRSGTDEPPTPPNVESVVQAQSGGRERAIEVTIEGYSLEVTVERRLLDGRRWRKVAENDLADLTDEPSPRTVSIADTVPAGMADARFEYRVIVRDRRGIRAVGEPEGRQ